MSNVAAAIGLAEAGIETRPVFHPVHTMGLRTHRFAQKTVAEDLAARGLNLPSRPDMATKTSSSSAAQSTDSTKMTKPLLLIGAGGYAKEVAQIAKRLDAKGMRWDRILYVATSRAEIGTEMLFGRVEYSTRTYSPAL